MALAADPKNNPDKKAQKKSASEAAKKEEAELKAQKREEKKKKPKLAGGFFSRIIMGLVSLGLIGILGGIGGIVFILFYFGRDLPDYHTLAKYDPPIVSRAYASDGRLLAEFAFEKRVFMPIESVPKLVINAFISAEDKNFYTHPGVDFTGVVRAAVDNITHPGKRMKGASTLTQQVAKNFFLKEEVEAGKDDIVAKFSRKIKEAILSFRIEQAMSKDKILELYLNEIYLGERSYGVAAASLEYFNKPLDELTIEEAAFLACLPKAPSDYDPEKNYAAALDRRNNYVLKEMQENGYITKAEMDMARLKPITVVKRDQTQVVNHPYFTEEVRRKLIELYGDNGLYKGGLIAHSTMVPEYQAIAEQALRNGLIAYDQRHGLHSDKIGHIDNMKDWKTELSKVQEPAGTENLSMAVILETGDKEAKIGLKDGKEAVITLNKMKWASTKGKAPSRVNELLHEGDVWLTEDSGEKDKDRNVYWLRQIPAVEGGIIVMDPHTGRIFAMAGGFSFQMSWFNRATQAIRQPGSSFKPFVYLAGLEAGFTPATLILDAPFTLDQGPGMPKWTPQNYNGESAGGPLTMRQGLEKSRNLMTVRLANYVGMDKVVDICNKFGVIDNLKPLLSMSIGAGETTLIRMVTAYSSFVNGGKKITPTLLDRVQDRHGKTIFVHNKSACDNCGPLTPWSNQATPEIPDTREQIADPRYMYQIVSMLEGVVQRGTATVLNSIGRPVAGKTGTTNDSKDTWFIGFTPDIIVGTYVGFDDPKPMGGKETGGHVAAPIVKEFMEKALKNVPPVPFRVPPGIRLVQVNPATGVRSQPGDEKSILEAFIEGTEPGDEPMMFTGEGVSTVTDVTNVGESVNTGLGGLY